MQTRATRLLDEASIRYEVGAYDHDPGTDSYGLEAAEALGLEPATVFKTLVVRLDGERRNLAVAVVPVDSRLDLKALARAAGAKRAEMAPVPDAERVTGYVKGGISPIAQRTPLPTFVDESAEICDLVWVSGGQRGLDIGLTPSDLLAVTGAGTAALATA